MKNNEHEISFNATCENFFFHLFQHYIFVYLFIQLIFILLKIIFIFSNELNEFTSIYHFRLNEYILIK